MLDYKSMMDTFLRRVTLNYSLKRLIGGRKHPTVRRSRSAAKTGEKGHHPSVKIIPATKLPLSEIFAIIKLSLYFRNNDEKHCAGRGETGMIRHIQVEMC